MKTIFSCGHPRTVENTRFDRPSGRCLKCDQARKAQLHRNRLKRAEEIWGSLYGLNELNDTDVQDHFRNGSERLRDRVISYLLERAA